MGKTILSVDDSASLRRLVLEALAGAGYTVAEAGNGAEALEQVRRTPFDLIITDLNMPVMDGVAFIREVRKLPDYHGVPIIFLTTETSGERRREARAAGATGWITKPFHRERLLAVTRKVLG